MKNRIQGELMMEIECGFVEFYGKDDKVISDFFKEANNKDILGLRKMNVRMSNVLFPMGHTLMPTLVYIYYLNAIYHVLREKNEKVPKPEEINEWEIKISQSIVKQPKVKTKGFLDYARTRAYAYYKSNMEKMHYFEEAWKANECLSKTALERLKETKRYKFVEGLIESNKPSEEIDFKVNGESIFIDRLENAERLDFIRRVVLPYDDKYSVFSNIVMYHCMIEQRPRENQTIYKDNWMDDYDKKRKGAKKYEKYNFDELENFYNLSGYFSYLIGTFKDNKVNRHKDYDIAMKYSQLQWIAKLAYNACLFEYDEIKRNKLEEKLKNEIEKAKNLFTGVKQSSNGNKPSKKIFEKSIANIFVDLESDEGLKSAVNFICEILDTIVGNEENKVGKIKRIVTERESAIMGDSSVLGSGIRAEKPMADYVDTFRWQYRAVGEYDDLEGSTENEVEEDMNKDVVEDDGDGSVSLPVWQSGNHGNLRTRCASYYIYELFYEPYE